MSSVRALASPDSLSHKLLGTFLVTFALFGAPYSQLLLFEANSEILGQLKRKFGGTCGWGCLQRNHKEAEEKEKESARGTMGRGKRGRQVLVSRLFRLPMVHRAHIFNRCHFYWNTQRECMWRREPPRKTANSELEHCWIAQSPVGHAALEGFSPISRTEEYRGYYMAARGYEF